MSETKSYIKVLSKKGVSGGVGFEAELCISEGTSKEIMSHLIDEAVELNKQLLDKIRI